MHSPIDILVSKLDKRMKEALARIGEREEYAHVRGSILRLGAEVSKHHWEWMKARKEGNTYQENQHTMQLYRLEKQLDKLFWSPNRLDFDINIDSR